MQTSSSISSFQSDILPPENLGNLSRAFHDAPEIVQHSPQIYRVKDLSIFGESPEICLTLHDMYRNLGKNGEFGLLIQEHMKSKLDPYSREFGIFGSNGKSVPGRPQAAAVFVNQSIEVLGVQRNTGFIIPLDHIPIKRQLHFNHESVHFFIRNITSNRSVNPLSDLPPGVKTSFLSIYESEAARCAYNPHVNGSQAWHAHNFMNKMIFQMPHLYSEGHLIGEIAAFSLQFELTFQGGILRKHCPALADALHATIMESHKLPIPRSFQPSPPQNYFCLADNIHTATLQELGATSAKTPFNLIIKSVGNAAKNTLEKYFQVATWGLNQLGKPKVAIPLEILFAYDKNQEHANLKAIVNGTATWRLSMSMYSLLGMLGRGPVLSIGIGIAAAEMLPDIHKMADRLPTDAEISSMASHNPALEALLHKQYGKQRGMIKAGGWLQDGFKALNPQRIWNKLARDKVDQAIDSLLEPGLDQRFEMIEQNLEKLEALLTEHFEGCIPSQSLELTHNKPMMLAGRFSPNVSTAIASAPPEIALTPDALANCTLPWQIVPSAGPKPAALQTTVELPEAELAGLSEEFEMASTEPQALAPSNYPINSPTIKKPTFNELATITDIRIGIGIGGGVGLVFSLASGAQFSVSTTGSAVITGVSVPLSNGFLTALGTGLLYGAPIAAVLIGIQLIMKKMQRDEQKAVKHLIHDQKSAQADIHQINHSMQTIESFFGSYQNGEIDKQAFLGQVNQLSSHLQQAAHKMRKRGDYAEKHPKQSKGKGFQYFYERTKLRQIDLDLKSITEEALAKRQVAEEFAPTLKGKPLETLVNNLSAFGNKRLLSLSEKFQQDAIKQEIVLRSKSGEVDALSHLDALANRPAAISLNPDNVAKPTHLQSHKFEGSKDRQERRSHRVKHWADDLNAAYQKFQTAAKSGDLEGIRNAKKEVDKQLKRTERHGDVQFSNYRVLNIKHCDTASAYYADFQKKISDNVKQTLARAEAAAQGKTTTESEVYFTTDEIKQLKIQSATAAYNEAFDKFGKPEAAPSDRDTHFQDMLKAAKILHTEGAADDKMQLVIDIGAEHPSYSQYKASIDRLKGLQANIESLQKTTEKMKETGIKREKFNQLYKLANELANELIAQKLSEKDVQKIAKNNEEEAKQILQWVLYIQTGYQNHLKINHYTHTILPAISTPAVRIVFHALHDFNRFEGYAALKACTQVLSMANSIAPNALPAGVTYLMAFRENAAVTDALYQNCVKSVKSNAFSNLKEHAKNPQELLNKSFSKQTTALQGANAAVQVVAKTTMIMTTKILGEGKAEGVNTVLDYTSSTVNHVSNAAYYTNVLNKTVKYLKAGELGLKVHKIGQGLTGMGMGFLDIYEFLATDPKTIGHSNQFKDIVKQYLPNFHGNLPETVWYYAGKDLAMTVTCIPLARSPVMVGVAAYQTWNLAYNSYYGKYTDDALSAIMLNVRYFMHQPPTSAIKEKMQSSINNLNYHLCHNFKVDHAESIIKQMAKQFGFECHVGDLEDQKQWDEIISQTVYAFKDSTKCLFTKYNIEILDGISVLFKRFTAIQQKMAAEPEYGPAHLQASLKELEKLADFVNHKFSRLTLEQSKKASNTIQWVQTTFTAIKTTFLTNFCIFYFSGRLEAGAWEVVETFDAVPQAERSTEHWFALGKAVHELSLESNGIALSQFKLFCFEAILGIVENKRELTAFEAVVKKIAIEIVQELKTYLKQDHGYSTQTTQFKPILENII